MCKSSFNSHSDRSFGKITQHDRKAACGNENKPFTLWLTGLSGAGKSTLASKIEEWIVEVGSNVYGLDGDNIRRGLNKDLSFSLADRFENIRRAAEICKLFNDAGVIVIASFISPGYRDRTAAKKIIGEDSFIEVYVEASLDICKRRDPKGLYAKALKGEIESFTGISSPYEVPMDPDIWVNTEVSTITECLEVVKVALSRRIG